MKEGHLDVFKQARGAIALESFLTSQGIVLVQVGQGLRAQDCPKGTCNTQEATGADKWKVSVRGDYWRCWSCGASGDVVKAGALLWNCSQTVAAQKLVKNALMQAAGGAASNLMRDISAQQKAIERVGDAVFCDIGGVSDEVRQSLNARGIPDVVIDEAIAQRVLVGLSTTPGEAKAQLERVCGKSLLQEAGMWQTASSYPSAAFRPLWMRYGPMGFEVRRVAEGNNVKGPKLLRYGATMAPFALHGREDQHVICKSAIDALSLRAMGNIGTLLGLPGDSSWRNAHDASLPNPAWFAHIRGHCQIAFAGTQDGRAKAVQLATSLSAAGIAADILEMDGDMDVNDMLMSCAI